MGPDTILHFRLNIDPEYQGWVLLFATFTAVWLMCLPCYCAGHSSEWARRFANRIQKHLPLFYMFMMMFNAGFLFLIVKWLPNWTFKDYIHTCIHFMAFLASHMVKFGTSIVMIIAFCFVVAFKDRIALMLGLDHKTLFKCKMRDCFGGASRFKTMELQILRVEDLPSANAFAANNVFVEVYLGYNEAMRTRVHLNAGSGCVIKETMQLNYDEDDDEDNMTIFVRNQKMVGGNELARIELNHLQLKNLKNESKSAGAANGGNGAWDQKYYFPKPLIPRGQIWIRMVPVSDDEYLADQATC